MHLPLVVWIVGGVIVGLVALVAFTTLAGRDKHDLGSVSLQWIAQHRSLDGYDS